MNAVLRPGVYQDPFGDLMILDVERGTLTGKWHPDMSEEQDLRLDQMSEDLLTQTKRTLFYMCDYLGEF